MYANLSQFNSCVCDCLQETLAKVRAELAKSDEDRKAQRHQIEELENRITQMELARKQLEGEIQRLKLVISEREHENAVRLICLSLLVARSQRNSTNTSTISFLLRTSLIDQLSRAAIG